MEGLRKYLIVFIHFLCLERRERREGGRDRERGKDGERQHRAERQHGRKAKKDMGKKKGQRRRMEGKGREGKGRLFGTTAETSLEPLSVPLLE